MVPDDIDKKDGLSRLFLSSENGVDDEEWENYYFSEIGFDSKKCRIILEKHLQKLPESVGIFVGIEGIDDKVEKKSEHGLIKD